MESFHGVSLTGSFTDFCASFICVETELSGEKNMNSPWRKQSNAFLICSFLSVKFVDVSFVHLVLIL